MSVTPSKVLASIPGWENSTVEELTGGLTNQTWRVTNGGRSGVLKIDSEARDTPLSTRVAEAQVQSMAAEAGIAANVIAAGDGFYFSDYVEGEVWTPARFEIDGNLEQLAASLQTLHDLPLTGRVFDAEAATNCYVERAQGLDSATIEKCTAIVSGTRMPDKLCCCHNDLVAENIITTPVLKFLDWEYACDNDPLFDLATVVEHHKLSEKQADRLLKAYFGESGVHRREALARQRTLYLALLCLWMASRPDGCPEELGRIVGRLAANPTAISSV